MASLQPPIGTRDFGPVEMALRRHVEGGMRETFRRFGYSEVATPTFEDLQLFTAKSGPGVLEELYHFKDKGGRDLALRPELTAPVLRMYHASYFADPKPLKWFYFGNCFRYDRPQSGRYREFWQFGCEQMGAGTPLAYAELLALAESVLRDAGLRDREFRVGHVRILRHCVDTFAFAPDVRTAMMRAIDKRDDEAIRRLAQEKGGCEAALDRLFLVMDAPLLAAARNALLQDLGEGDEGAGLRGALDELEAVFRHLEAFGVRDVRLDLGIARGLDYYTGIVFEVHAPVLGAQKQVLGGGGYDLSGVFAGQPIATMGFGLGFDRTILALEKEAEAAGGKSPFPPPSGPAVCLAALSEAALAEVLPLAARLRRQGLAVELDLMGRKPGAVAKHAAAIGCRLLVLVGDRDLESARVQVKELATGTVREVGLGELERALLP